MQPYPLVRAPRDHPHPQAVPAVPRVLGGALDEGRGADGEAEAGVGVAGEGGRFVGFGVGQGAGGFDSGGGVGVGRRGSGRGRGRRRGRGRGRGRGGCAEAHGDQQLVLLLEDGLFLPGREEHEEAEVAGLGALPACGGWMWGVEAGRGG